MTEGRITATVDGIEFTIGGLSLNTEFDYEHLPKEFKWEFFPDKHGGIAIPFPVNPHDTEAVVVGKNHRGTFENVVGFPFEQLMDSHGADSDPLITDITVEYDFKFKLVNVAFESIPAFAQRKDVIDEMDFQAREVEVMPDS